MNKYEVRSLVDLGMDIGSHSCTRRHLNRLPVKELTRELRESKIFLEALIGRSVDTIAYSGGQCGKREFKISKEVGYLLDRTTNSGLNNLPLKTEPSSVSQLRTVSILNHSRKS